jgi:6-pyruvoyltetrahydropterin/6-carboxytetrahydropterin synthase
VVRLSRAIEFSASLRCVRPDLSEAENLGLFGPRAQQHGHNYRLEVTVRGEPDPVTGMVIDIKAIQGLLEREIMERFDHRDLNRDTPYFEKMPPTPENLARVIREILLKAFPEGMLDRIRLQPDDDTWVEIVEPEARA